MRFNHSKATVRTVVLAVCILLLGASWAAAQQQVNLTAGPSHGHLPDGSSVPMWGYTCGTRSGRFNGDLREAESGGRRGWSPVVITVPTGQDLQINLTNNLIFRRRRREFPRR